MLSIIMFKDIQNFKEKSWNNKCLYKEINLNMMDSRCLCLNELWVKFSHQNLSLDWEYLETLWRKKCWQQLCFRYTKALGNFFFFLRRGYWSRDDWLHRTFGKYVTILAWAFLENKVSKAKETANEYCGERCNTKAERMRR